MRQLPRLKTVRLVYRPAEDRSMTFVLTRAFIHQNNVTLERPAPGFGYVRISGFNEQTVPDLVDRLKVQNVGVQPDLPVDDHPPDQSGDLPAVREIDLDRHLSSQAGRPDTALEQTHAREVTGQRQTIEAQRAQSSNPSVGRRPTTQPVVYGKPGDFMLSQALNWLQHKPVSLSKAKPE